MNKDVSKPYERFWALLKPDSKDISDIYLFAIIGAEYILQLLPKGTHQYEKFIKPSELAQFTRAAGLEVIELKGMTYNPITQIYRLGSGILRQKYKI